MKRIIIFIVAVLFMPSTSFSAWPPSSDKQAIDMDRVFDVNYYLILDGSGSMSGDNIRIAKEALCRFIDDIDSNVNVALYVFDHRGSGERTPFRIANTQGKSALKAYVKYSVEAGGGTPLTEAVLMARETITRKAQMQAGYGEYRVIIVTDGAADNERALDSAVNSLNQETPIVVYTIGFNVPVEHTLNDSNKSVYYTANNLTQLVAALKKASKAEATFNDSAGFDVSEFSESELSRK